MTSSKAEKKRILFVEDDADSQQLIGLTIAGYSVVTAYDFTEGLRLARQRYFDVYILDNWLPDRTGIELCRHIREFDPHTPILFYSAAARERDIEEALNAGAHAYLVKPVSFEELEQAVARLTLVSSEMVSEARLAEIAAIREELAIRARENDRRFEAAIGKRLRAEEKALRAKATLAFLTANGTRGDFARWWPSVFVEEVRSHRDV